MSRLEKYTMDIPEDLADAFRDMPMGERAPMVAKAVATLTSGRAYLVLIDGSDDEECTVIGNLPPEGMVSLLEEALHAAREQAKARAN